MKKIQHLILAGCMALAGLCNAQRPLDYWMVIDRSNLPSVTTWCTNAPPSAGDGIAAWTNDSLQYLAGRYVVLQQYEESASNRYFVSLETVTRGQYADDYAGVPGDPMAPLEVSETTEVNVTNYLAKLSAQMGIPVGSINASGTDNAYTPLDYGSAPESFFLYIKTVYQLTVSGGTGSVYTNAGETVLIEADDPAAFVKWVVVPPEAASDFGGGFSETSPSTSVVMPFYDVTVTAAHAYTLTIRYDNNTDALYNQLPTNSTAVIGILAPDLPEKTFTGWTVNPPSTELGAEFDAGAMFTTIVMPATNIVLNANYVDTTYPLTVVNGSGSGNYVKNFSVTITANIVPTGFEFDCWTNAVNVTVTDPLASPTTVTMQGDEATITAMYKPIKVAQKTYMIVDLEGSSTEPTYLDEPPSGSWGSSHKTSQMVFRKVAAGSFTMGSPASEPGRGNGETEHTVTFTNDFYLGLFEVTQAQWLNVAGGLNPSYFSETNSFFGTDARPVEQVSYENIRGAYAKANWPTQRNPTSDSFMGVLRNSTRLFTADLPTEAQWEYACRAGTAGATAGDADSVAWYTVNGGGETHDVGTKVPNAWGLYDMHGNVAEICLDWFRDDGPGASAQTNPVGPNNSGNLLPIRVMRGGAYNSALTDIRSAFRDRTYVTNYVTGAGEVRSNILRQAGFRVAVPQTKASYELTVVNGVINTGGVFTEGTQIGLMSAPAPDGDKFAVWDVSPENLANALGSGFDAREERTLLAMPSGSVTLTAVYIPVGASGPFRFAVVNSSGHTQVLWKAGNAVFTLEAPPPPAWHTFNGWTVPPGADLGAGFDPASAVTSVTMPEEDVTVTPVYVLDIPDFSAPLTNMTGVAFSLDAGDGQRPGTFTAKGLPSGLKIDRNTGMITGIPSKAGTFTVTVTVKHTDGTLPITYPVTITVEALPATAQGTFTGYISADDGSSTNRICGLLTFKVSAKGAISAKVDTQSASYSFSGKSWASVTGDIFSVTLVRKQGEKLTLVLDAANKGLTSGEFVSVAGTFEARAYRNAFMGKKTDPEQAILVPYKGYYTVALPMDPIEIPVAAGVTNTQSGSGYLAITVRDRAAVKIAGKLADGTSVSSSTTLIVVDDDNAYVPLFVKLYSRRGVFAGLLHIDRASTPTLQVTSVGETYLEWMYPGKSVKLPDDNFTTQISAYGASYDTQANIQTAYTGMVFQAEGIGWTNTLTLVSGSSGSVALPKKGVDNPDGVTLKAAKKTGIFSGSFKTIDSVTGKTVTLKHAGILTRNGDDYVGEGSYIWTWKAGGYTLKSSHLVWIEP